MKRLTVYCGSSSGFDPVFKDTAFELGQLLADNDFGLVYGGAKVGLMGAVADGILSKGGEAIGVLPRFLAEKELQHESLSEILIVETMHERKLKMCELADGFIALPGGFGTLEEMFEILTWSQLALHTKPVGALNIKDYYAPLLLFIEGMIEKGFLKQEYRELLLVDEDTIGLLEKLKDFKPLKNDKWFEVN